MFVSVFRLVCPGALTRCVIYPFYTKESIVSLIGTLFFHAIFRYLQRPVPAHLPTVRARSLLPRGVERVKLFRRTLFAFLTGNEAMHLKNFSLITRGDIVSLSPAYDLLNTTIALVNPIEELALPLHGKKSKLKRDDLIDYFGQECLKLTPKAIDRVLSDLATALPRWFDLLDSSFLRLVMRTVYRDVLQVRASRLRL